MHSCVCVHVMYICYAHVCVLIYDFIRIHLFLYIILLFFLFQHGADPTGKLNSFPAFSSAITSAYENSTTQIVWIPPGNYLVPDHVMLKKNISIMVCSTYIYIALYFGLGFCVKIHPRGHIPFFSSSYTHKHIYRVQVLGSLF